MDRNELVEGIRGVLYKKANKKGWGELTGLLAQWPDDTLPEVVVDYLRSAGLEGLWSKYLPRVGYTDVERLAQAPKVERNIAALIEGAVPSARSAFAEYEEEIFSHYEAADDNREVESWSIDDAVVARRFDQDLEIRMRKTIFRAKEDEYPLSFYVDGAIRVRLKNGDVFQSRDCSFSVTMHYSESALHMQAGFDVGEFSQWAAAGFDEDWYASHYYNEYYEDDEWE